MLAALGERSEDVSARIAGVGERAIHTLDQQMASLAALLTRRTDELISAVNGSAADPVRALSALTGQLRAEVAESSEALRNVAADATHRSSEALDALLKRLTEQVEASSASLRAAVTRSSEDLVEALAGASDRMRNELTVVIDNLGQTSAVIDRTIGSAGDRLSAVQSGLAARVEEFQRALGGIASQVTTLARLSAATQSDAGALAGQLAQHTEALGAVGRDLAQQQQSLDLALEHRRNSLQALISDLSGRSETFEATLGRFAANVEDSFARAQARAQEIGAALASATKGASIAVAGQFETIRDAAAKERERTAQTLQTTLEQTNVQLSSALEHAADRFRQSVAEVKDMASEVQRELDQTRQELRRGVLELPQETSETAEAMRRVVSDQIRALKELAALVSESGATYDVAEPTPLAAATTAVGGPRFENPQPRVMEGVRRVEAPSPREAARARSPEAIAAPVIEAPAPADRCCGSRLAASRRPGAVVVDPARRRIAAGHDSGDFGAHAGIRPRPGRMAFEPACGRLARRARGRVAAWSGDPGSANPGNRRLHRQCGRDGNVGAMEARRCRRNLTPPLHRGRPTGVRRNSAPLSRRPPVPRHDDALHAGIRAPAGQDRSERPRRLAVARLSHVQHRQGLHNSRARLGPARLEQVGRDCSRAVHSPSGDGRPSGR